MTERKKLLYAVGITLGVYISLKYLLPYVIPFFIAYFLVHLFNPVIIIIQKRIPWKKEILVSVLLAVFLILFSLMFYWVYCMLMEQIRRIVLNYEYYNHCFCSWLDSCCSMVEQKLGIGVEEVRSFVYAEVEHVTENIQVYIVPNVLNYSVRYLKKALDAGAFLLILFVSVILLMRDYDEMHEKLQKYEWYGHLHHITERMWMRGGMYLKAQFTIIAVIILICTLGLWALGNPYFLVLGIVVGMTDALPFIGTGTVLLPIAAVMAVRGELRLMAGYAGLFLFTYFVREFLEPRLIGAKLGIYPIVMIMVVYAGLYLFGPAGVLLGPVGLLLIMEIWYEIMQDPKRSL